MRVLVRRARPPEPERHAPEGIPLYAEPRLLVPWSSRWDEFPKNLRAAVTGERVSRARLAGFQVPLRGGAMRPRSLGLSAAIHAAAIAVLAMLPLVFGPRPLTAEERARVHAQRLTWYVFDDELPVISPEPGGGQKLSEKGGTQPGPSPHGATGFSSQVIISNPPQPDNASQTIFQPDTPDIRITQEVRIPNVVMWAHQAQRPALGFLPAPDVRIAQAPRLLLPADIVRPAPPLDLVKREVANLNTPQLGVPAVEPPAPEVPNVEKRLSDLRIAAANVLNQPKLPVPAGTTAPVTQPDDAGRAEAPESDAQETPAPQVASGGNGGALGRVIAIGVNPAPPGGPISIPAGNRAGSFSLGPEADLSGKTPGTPYGSVAGLKGAGAVGPAPAGEGQGEGSGTGAGLGNGTRQIAEIRVPGLSVSGGVRPPSAAMGPVVSGPPPPAPPVRLPEAPKARAAPERETRAALLSRETRPRPALPDWGRAGDLRDKGFLTGKKIYTVYINMPNLASQSGSWIMRFAELADRTPNEEMELTAPVARRKVDPGYHPDALRERVRGAVMLYAIIQRDGAVTSVKVVRGLDPRLDERAVSALLRWQFDPATRNGQPVETEALVQIPFVPSANGTPF